jgi:septum formation protein
VVEINSTVLESDEGAEIVLASESPRRRQLLDFLKIPHRVVPAAVDERSLTAAGPREFALKAALLKATALDDKLEKGTLVIAADTVVVRNNEIYMKPLDQQDAVRMLRNLAGQTHQVISGIALREVGRATQLDAASTDVTIRALSEEEIAEYVQSGEPMDKAGAYGIQSIGGSLVQQIAGDYFNVVGLPVDKLLVMLEAHLDTMPFLQRRQELTPQSFKSFISEC